MSPILPPRQPAISIFEKPAVNLPARSENSTWKGSAQQCAALFHAPYADAYFDIGARRRLAGRRFTQPRRRL